MFFSSFKLIDRWIEKISTFGLVVSIFSMLFFSVLTIVLRWFNVTYLWFDPLVRYLVFLCAFLGGVIATGRGSHIAIDIIGKYLESLHLDYWQKQIKRVISLISFCTIIWLIVASMQFFKVEQIYGQVVFLGFHSSFFVAIIPFGFSLIAFRFLFLFLISFEKDLETH